MERTEWDIVTKLKLIGFVISVALFFALVLCSEPGFVFIVDHANLLFHEAGIRSSVCSASASKLTAAQSGNWCSLSCWR